MNQIFFSESFGDKQLFSFVSVILVEMNENGEVSLRYSQKLAVGVTLLSKDITMQWCLDASVS